LELTYANYFLTRHQGEGRDSDLPWVRQLRESPPAGIETLKEAWADPQLRSLSTELLLLACTLGSALGGTPQRFLADPPALTARRRLHAPTPRPWRGARATAWASSWASGARGRPRSATPSASGWRSSSACGPPPRWAPGCSAR